MLASHELAGPQLKRTFSSRAAVLWKAGTPCGHLLATISGGPSTRAELGMQFSPKLLDQIRARMPVSQVVSRKVALKRAGREMKGLSPFKQERTPSFFVNCQSAL